MSRDMDRELLELLRNNGRESIANLARKLGVSRATVKEHMATLERRKIIEGYTIRYHPLHEQQKINAYLMIEINPKQAASVVRHMEKIAAVQSLFSISGNYDLMALVSCDNTEQLDQVIDQIAGLDGIDKTLTSVVLGTKLQR
ncbi:MAG: Lrp/AsnC family transcriptional regulator [Gammaproteobacteria bacterium]|nr:MAG: Lrp/AsnC family transcriptional regulator [Gammaproteobacteria bacterium]